MKKRLRVRLHPTPRPGSFIGPPASREHVLTEMRKWRRVIQESGLKVN